jgi:hypothetical protein
MATSATPGYHAIGPNNRVGFDSYGAMPNPLVGVFVGSNYISMTATTVQYNGNIGVHVTGNNNSIYGNIVDSNTGDGIEIQGPGSNNMLGCITNCLFGGPITGNIVTNNGGNGVVITGTTATGNYVMGNRIGVDGSGGSAANGANGILIYDASNNTVSDGLSDLYVNRIGSNMLDGVRLDGNAFGNSIANNLIYQNRNNGVTITGGAHDNAIGGNSTAYANNIYQNTWDGVRIYGNTDTVNANLIYSNSYNGVYLLGSANGNVVGAGSTVPNSIYSNSLDGVCLAGTAHSNTIRSNYIGTDSALNPRGNLGNGVSVYGSAHDNVLGDASGYNNIYYNQLNGIVLSGASVMNNALNLNVVGYNSQNGLLITNGAHNNLIDQPGNYMNSFNNSALNGILLSLGAHDNTISFNRMYANTHNGIELTDSGTINNVITRTEIYLNHMDGINERNSATQNSWSHLSTYGNQGLGIDKFATSDSSNTINGPFPQITSVAKSGGNVVVSGTASPSYFGGNTVWVELYKMDINPLGFAEGKTYLGNGQTQLGTGYWTIAYPASAPGCYVAFQTTIDNTGKSTSSEFSPNSCQIFLPLIKR